jgi:Ala-tRNA(Pro) deacylase
MSIAKRVKWFLEVNRVDYDVVEHRGGEPGDTTDAASIPSDHVAKAHLLEDAEGYLMRVLPADSPLDLERVNRQLHRSLQRATDSETAELFFDCEAGAIPAVGTAYGIPTVVDRSLVGHRDIYFDAGMGEDLVHMRCDDFLSLIPDAIETDLPS